MYLIKVCRIQQSYDLLAKSRRQRSGASTPLRFSVAVVAQIEVLEAAFPTGAVDLSVFEACQSPILAASVTHWLAGSVSY